MYKDGLVCADAGTTVAFAGGNGGNFPGRMLHLPEVLAITGLSKSTLYRLIASGDFPAGVKLGKRMTRWPESDVVQWIDGKVRASRQATLKTSEAK